MNPTIIDRIRNEPEDHLRRKWVYFKEVACPESERFYGELVASISKALLSMEQLQQTLSSDPFKNL